MHDLFVPIPRITTYHHFHFCNTHPGSVFMREFADSPEKRLTILKLGSDPVRGVLPSTLLPAGLSPERELYLYKQMRPFCQAEFRDVTCPVPQAHQQASQLQDVGLPPVKQSKRLCFHCWRPGHTKTKQGSHMPTPLKTTLNSGLNCLVNTFLYSAFL